MGGKKSTVQQQSLPKYAKPYFTGLLQSGQAESKRPHEQYGGTRQAGFSQAEREAQAGVGEMFREGDVPDLGIAGGYLGQAADIAGSPRMWGRDAYSQYASPFFEEVIDIEKREAARDAAIQGRTAGLGSAGRGTFGSYRSGIMGAERGRNLGQLQHDIESTGRQRAWDQAMTAFGADEGRRLQHAELQASIAGQAAAFGKQRQEQSLQRLAAMEQVGVGQREMEQAAMDLAYQDWIAEQNWNKTQLGFMNEILRGLPGGMDTRSIAQGPSAGQTAAGVTTAGLGALLQGYGIYKNA